MERKVIYTGFLIPVVDGEMWLAQRPTEWVKGLGDICAIGGKAERRANQHSEPVYIEKMGGARVASIADRIAEQDGRELPLDTALRECWEELFQEANPRAHEFFDALRLGMVVDMSERFPNTQFCHYMYLAKLSRRDFKPDPREVVALYRLVDVKPESIVPITRIALEEIRFQSIEEWGGRFTPYLGMKLHEQIPQFPNLPYRFTGMPGPHVHPSFLRSIYDEPYRTLLENFRKGSTDL